MIQTLPLALPGTPVDLHRIDLTALYSKGWGVQADDVAAAPNGEVYALYRVYRYTYGVVDGEHDPATANFAYQIITRYSAGGEVLASALCCLPTTADETASAVVDGIDMTLCVLPDGTLAISACPSNTTLVTPDLSRVVATYDAKDHRRAVPASSQRPHPTPGEERDHHRRCWVAAIQAAYESASRRDNQVVLVAHSLGCWAAAYWLEQARPDTVAAFLVAPPNPQGPAFPRGAAPTFLGLSARPLPCPSLMVASDDDPYCDPTTSASFAHEWQAKGHLIGSHGHINSNSDLGDWQAGLKRLRRLVDC